MTDFDIFFEALKGPDPLQLLLSSIKSGSLEDVSESVRTLRHQDSEIDISPALLQCVKCDRLDALHLLLAEGGRPDEDAVEAAACSGRPSFVAPLLEYGWPINKSLRFGRMPSILCFAINREELMDWLLARGADPNAFSTAADTPLSVAVADGSLATIRKLLDAGGNATEGNLLHRAAERTDVSADIIDLLVSRGAQVEAIEFQNPLACRLRHPLTRGTALHVACRVGNVEAVSALLRHGASPTSTRRRYHEEERTTSIDVARKEGNDVILALLIRTARM